MWTSRHHAIDPLVLLTGLLLLAAALRMLPLADNRFHPDEALYARWGLRIAHGRDPLLAGEPVDKPPLWPYVLAGSFGLFGTSELAARIPSFAASLLSVALTYRLSRDLFGARRTAASAAALMALSPYSILFAVTAFTDPLLVLWLLAALVANVRGRMGWSGLFFGLALATKQTAVLFIPLLIGMALLYTEARRPDRSLLPFALGLSPIVLLLLIWDGARQAPLGFWQQSIASYGGLRLAMPAELPARLSSWSERFSYIWGSPWWTGLLTLAALASPLVITRGGRPGRALRSWRAQRPAKSTLLLVGFAASFLAMHVLLTFSVWDRYLLGLVPILSLLAAQTIARLSRPALRPALAVGLVILLLGPAWQAARSDYPVGGDHGAYDGIDQVAAYLRRMPWGTVLYDHALNWELGYYLFDGPVYVAWYGSPDHLASDLGRFAQASEPRLLILPSWQTADGVAEAIGAAQYRQDLVLTTFRRDGQVSFSVYQLTPDQHAGADGGP